MTFKKLCLTFLCLWSHQTTPNQFHDAVEKLFVNNFDLVKEILSKYANDENDERKHTEINAQDEQGRTPLYLAASNNLLDVIELLFEHGAIASINTPDNFDCVPLHWACFQSNVKMAELFLAHGASKTINAQDKESKATPLISAAELCRGRDASLIKLLLTHGADKSVNVPDYKNFTPLMWAVENKNMDVAQLLIEYGASETINNIGIKQNLTCLSLAVSKNDYHLTKLVLENGAYKSIDVPGRARGGEIRSPLWVATYNKNKDIVELLVKYGALKSARSMQKVGFTDIFYVAASKKDLSLVKYFLRKGMGDLVDFSSKGHTALLAAEFAQSYEMIRLLVYFNARGTGFTYFDIMMNPKIQEIHEQKKKGLPYYSEEELKEFRQIKTDAIFANNDVSDKFLKCFDDQVCFESVQSRLVIRFEN